MFVKVTGHELCSYTKYCNHVTMSEKYDAWAAFHTPDPLMGTCQFETTRYVVSELLDDPGNCRRYIDPEQSLYHQSESLLSEQQELRDALKWAEGFLQGPAGAHSEFCSAEYVCSTVINDRAYVTVENSEVCQPRSSSYKNKRREKNCMCGYKPLFQSDPLRPSSCSSVKDEETWLGSRETENMRSLKLQHTNNKQTLRQVNCSTSRPHVSNQRHHKGTSDCSSVQTLASDSATRFFKKSSALFGAVSTVQPLHESSEFTDTNFKAAGVYSKKKRSDNQQERCEETEPMENYKELKQNVKRKQKDRESSLDFAECRYDEINCSEKEEIPERRSKTAGPSLGLKMKLPPHLTVFEQYQLCVDRLHRPTSSKHIKQSRLTQSVRKSSLSAASRLNCHFTNPENKTHPEDISQRAAESAEQGAACLLGEGLDRSHYNMDQSAPSEYFRAKSGDTDRANKTSAATEAGGQQIHLEGNQSDDPLKKSANDGVSYDAAINTPDETSWRQPEEFETSAFTAHPGQLLNKKRHPSSMKGDQRAVTAPKRTTGTGVWKRRCESSNDDLTDRLSPSNHKNTIKSSKKLRSQKRTKTPDSSVKRASSDSDTHTIQQTTATHTLQREVTPPAESAAECVNTRAGVPDCNRWMCLPDEVWLSILSLVPHRDLCRVLRVCRRLRSLADDHTLWRNLRVENSDLNEEWLLHAGRRCPRTLCLYSCSSLSVSSSALEQFFSLCRNSLQELKVTSCVGAGLHGDQVLALIGQLCDHVTSVDVSWSGATDSGLKALIDSSQRATLRSVVLNGCHITNVPLKKLIMKHHESLRRLEVFGCHFLSPSCLQTLYEMCPCLQHLNIGRVPKVHMHSFTAMASQLKCLISLNLTGLQVVNDASVDSLLQNCVKLECLNLSSCPAVTDVTLHNISKHTPSIRSLGLSGCAAVTDAGIQSLALGCRRLQQLDLSSTRTGNRGVSLLANYCSSHLHTVKLSFCHVTSEFILKLCRNCKRLSVLHLYGCVRPPTEIQISNMNSTVKVFPPH